MSTADFDVDFFGNFDENSSHSQDQDQEKDKSKSYDTVQLVDQLTAIYKNGNSEIEQQEQEEKISMARQNVEGSMKKSEFESETAAEKEKREMSNKIAKMGGILILSFLLLNFVLVAMVMNRMSEFSSSFSSAAGDFSAVLNQTAETGKIVDELKFELGGIEKWVNSTEEKFESHHFRVEALSNQTKIEEEMKTLHQDNRQLKKSLEELKEQFESQSQKLDKLESHQIQIEALLNETKVEEQFEALENKNQRLEKPLEELKEQFESLSQKFDQLERNISLEFKRAPTENEDEESIDPQSISSCSVAMEILPSPRSQKLSIYPHGNSTSLKVLCDFETDGGGWTIIQKRTSGPNEQFKQNWNAYVNGFGSVSGNFWMGLENIRALTKNGDQELRIDLEDFEGVIKWAKYSRFSVSGASDFYRLILTGFYTNSTLGDSLAARHSGKKFTTIDKDNDNYPGFNCAQQRGGGGWWFDACTDSNLNGLYFEKGESDPSLDGIYWGHQQGDYYTLIKTEMKIRPRK